ncbi:LysR substrate-binding domain-containing protein [Streptosporangium lutulentum]
MRSFATAHRGRLHLGSFWSAGFRLVLAVLAEFLRDRPQVDVRYEEGDPQVTIPAVIEGRLDLAVVFEYGMVPHSWPRDLDMTLIMEEPLYLLVPTGHRLVGRKRIQFGELAADRWISYTEGMDAARNLSYICAAAVSSLTCCSAPTTTTCPSSSCARAGGRDRAGAGHDRVT